MLSMFLRTRSSLLRLVAQQSVADVRLRKRSYVLVVFVRVFYTATVVNAKVFVCLFHFHAFINQYRLNELV